MTATLDEILETFSLLDDWEERYRYVIDLGKSLPPLPAADRIEANKVQGCASQVWLTTRVEDGGDGPRLVFAGESDAHIVQGLVAILIALYSGSTPAEVMDKDPIALFDSIGLSSHLTPQRSNGVRSMVERIRRDAAAIPAAA